MREAAGMIAAHAPSPWPDTGMSDGDIRLYHGTSEPLDKIRTLGLRPSRRDAVGLTDNPELALDYATTDRERTGNSSIVVVSVHVRDLDVTKLEPDLDHSPHCGSWQESLRDSDQCMYLDTIPPNLLRVEDYQ